MNATASSVKTSVRYSSTSTISNPRYTPARSGRSVRAGPMLSTPGARESMKMLPPANTPKYSSKPRPMG